MEKDNVEKIVKELGLTFETSNGEQSGEQTSILPELGDGVSLEERLYGGKPQGYVVYSKLFKSSQAPEEPSRRPKFIRDITEPAPKNVKTAAGNFAIPAFATYASGVNFPYNDNTTKELRTNCYVVGLNGAGKGFVKDLLDVILRPIKEDDEPEWEGHLEYNEEKEAAGDEKTRKRPKTKIRVLPTNITKPELNDIGKNTDGKPLFMHVPEPDELDTLKGGPKGRQHFEILKKADDENNTAGQLRAGSKSVSAKYCLRLNYVIEIRPTQLLGFFNQEIINGARDRASFVEVPPLEDKHQWPTRGEMGDKYFEKILPYIRNIQAAKGTITCSRINKLIDKIRKEFFEYYDETQDDVLELITHRALCRAFKRACLIYIAEGQQWDPALSTWIRWSFMYDMWMHFHYFYDAINGKNAQLQTTKKGPDSIVDMLGDEFTFGQLKQLYIEQGKDANDKQLHGVLRTWVNRKKVKRTETGFRKIKK